MAPDDTTGTPVQSAVRLPPLKSIQAFEAAARHSSFKVAAEELCVTPTAVSHQVKALEDQLGVKLFHRLTRSLRLTAAGEVYAPFAIQAFQKLAEGSLALLSDEVEGRIVISTTTSFAGQWLAPRLPRFQEMHQGLSVRVLSSDRVANFASEGVDVAIRYGFGDYPDMHVAWVLDDYVAPVCAPSFPIDPGRPSDLLELPLINYEWSGFSQVDPRWSKWLRSVEINEAPRNEVVTYSDEHMCLQAAKEGHGVALVSLIAAANDLESGSLIAPFEGRLKNKSYFLVCPESAVMQAKVRAFQNWLLDEADVFRDSEVGQKFLEPDFMR
ncbi:MAG: transcriptional regulator GcvA [Boseongicola sp.]|nr:transcriptional regulator GcvA [Boseongicola sp.]